MDLLNTFALKSNSKIKINFNGGNLSSDGGLPLIKEFASQIGLIQLVRGLFKANDYTECRFHTDPDNLMQIVYQIIAAYFEGEGFNFHYQAHGYHPLLYYDGITGDLLKAELRDGTQYCSKDADRFMIPLLQEYRHNDPSLPLYLRGDSGFASPDLYMACEENDCKYAIRLKQNLTLLRYAEDAEIDLNRVTR